jgi:hypothetical protein
VKVLYSNFIIGFFIFDEQWLLGNFQPQNSKLNFEHAIYVFVAKKFKQNLIL